MAHVVVMGSGIGGISAAFESKAALGSGARVSVVNNSPDFCFVPSLPWAAVGWRTRQQITFPLEAPFSRKGIEFNSSGVTEVKPDDNQLVLGDGSTLDYDFLIIATGPKLAFDEVEGLGPDGHTKSICTIDHAEQTFGRWEHFCADPGPMIVGAVQGASCFGPGYEFAFIADTDLRKRKKRSKVPMTFVTSEPYIGHLGLGGVGDSKGILEHELRQRHIKWICNAKVTKVAHDMMFVDEHDEDGNVIKQHELPHQFSMMVPAFKGIDPVAAVGDDLCNPRGFVKVDEYQRNSRWNNIYGVGVGIAIPPVEATVVPTGAPKTGYMIDSMVTASIANIKSTIDGEEPSAIPTWNAICLADMGDR